MTQGFKMSPIFACLVIFLGSQYILGLELDLNSASSENGVESTRIARQAHGDSYKVNGFKTSANANSIGHYSGKTYLHFAGVETNWMESHVFCRERGLQLLSLNAMDEFDFVEGFVRQAWGEQFYTRKALAWVAIHDLFHEGHFTDLYTGRPFHLLESFVNSGQPDNAGGREHCLELRRNSEDLLDFNDSRCDEPNYGVVCTHRSLDYVQNCESTWNSCVKYVN